MGPTASLLPCGTRLHLQHGPIDLIIGADGERQKAFEAARLRFDTVLAELVEELPLLKAQFTAHMPAPDGAVAKRMDGAVRPHSQTYLTRMISVAGAVADEILAAMTSAARLRRAYVNNGGDIALHLDPEEEFSMAMAGHDGTDLGRIHLAGQDRVGGIATSGRHGRSLSLGIADSVTVLAEKAASADVAATLIANAVTLPDHPAIHRRPAWDIQPDSDLAELPVTVGCDALALRDIDTALGSGLDVAQTMWRGGHIRAAALFLKGESRLVGETGFTAVTRTVQHA